MTVETAVVINALDANLPAAGDTIPEGDDHLRLIKSVLKLTFPSMVAAASTFMTGTIFQAADAATARTLLGLTAGTIYAPIAATTRMLFQQTAAPTGWTKEIGVAFNNKALRLQTGTVTSGGATAFSTVFGSGKNTGGYTLQVADIPAHSHGITDPAHNHSALFGSTASGGNIAGSDNSAFGTGSVANNTTGITINNTGGGGSHLHSLSLDLQFQDVIIAAKD